MSRWRFFSRGSLPLEERGSGAYVPASRRDREEKEAVSRPIAAGTEACSHQSISAVLEGSVEAALCGCRSFETASKAGRLRA